METVRLRVVKPGIRNPGNFGRVVPMDGTVKVLKASALWTSYWMRRLRDGDAVEIPLKLVEPKVEEPAVEPVAPKPKRARKKKEE